ncbi:helix-turn-helix transcriptional regulator [Virgibacillus sp. YIM 98842]|uniref:helix-turn-helix domain-containing protein n=1 Tax=Virgibacillus sp. YIM 98842 TaxID=2663533 RepID=UPI0013DAD458|nr:helix-turn-helix transcriptional regulator [Virgibacillus sp. YIM 98842]
MGYIQSNLRVLMAKHGLNIQRVKEKTSLSRTTISNLYNNLGAGVQFDTMKQLCELFRCQPGDLFSYIDLDFGFEIIGDNSNVEMVEDTYTLEGQGGSYDYVSEITTELVIKCKLIYEGEKYDFNFKTIVQYGIDHEKNIDELKVSLSPTFEYTLEYKLELSPFIVNDISESLDELLLDWGFDSFNGEEIEGIVSVSVEHDMLFESNGLDKEENDKIVDGLIKKYQNKKEGD